MRAIDADRLTREEILHLWYHLPNGELACPKVDIDNAPTINAIVIPENATNGDVIKAMFPNAKISLIRSQTEKTKVAVEWGFEPLPSYYNLFYEEWWNAPYKEVSE